MRYILPILCIGVMILTACVASASPEITDWNNSITNDQLFTFALTNGLTATFNVIDVSEAVTQYNWWVDDSVVVNNNPSLSRSWTTPFLHNVTVETVTANGSAFLTWSPAVQRALAVTTSETINETPYNEMIESMEGNGDFEQFFNATTLPFIYAIGNFFFVFIWGMYFGMVWIRQDNVMVPASVGLILGIVLFAFLPETFYVGALSLVLLSASAMVYNLYKER